MGDPFVLRQQGKYFLFGTTKTERGFEFYVSSNLVQWRRGGWAWEKSNDSWATGLLWAPEVFHYRNRFFLIYSGQLRGAPRWQMRLALAVADQPQGPYRDLHAPWFDLGESTIDGHVFIDDDGKPYLYFSRNGAKDGYLYGILCGGGPGAGPIPPRRRANSVVGGHSTLGMCRPGQEPMQRGAERLQAQRHLLHDVFSQQHVDQRLRNWSRHCPKSPRALDQILRQSHGSIGSEYGVSGPGHNSIVQSPDDHEIFAVYHAHADREKPSGPRVICIDRLFFDPEGNLRIKGPTRSPQPYPSGATPDEGLR
jgi:hypothetical protein